MDLAVSPVRKPGRPKAQSQQEEPETTETVVDLGFKVDREKTYIFETLKKSENPRNENLGSICKIFDTAEKRYRDIRYLPTAPSIFVEEWDDSFIEMPEIPLGFYRNQLVASGEDIRLMEYLMCHQLYEHSPYRVQNKPAFFTLMDKEVQDQIKAKRHETELKALEAIKTIPFEDLKPIARIIFGVTETSQTAIMNAMNEVIKKPKQGSEKQSGAERVLDNLVNPKLIRQYNIQTGLDRGYIVADLNKMQARLTDGNVFICNLNTRNPVKELTDWSFTTEGDKWYVLLKQKI